MISAVDSTSFLVNAATGANASSVSILATIVHCRPASLTGAYAASVSRPR